jgi:hypothetical protein
VCIALALAGALGTCGSSASALETVTVPAQVEAVEWSPATLLPDGHPAAGRTFTLAIEAGYCAGGPKPRIHHVAVVERPKTAERPFRSAVITVFEEWPEHVAGVPVAQSGPEYAPAATFLCAGIGGTRVKRVAFKRPVRSLILFDGSRSPARRIWPKPGKVAGAIANPGAGDLR